MQTQEHESIWSHLTAVPFTQGYVNVNGLNTRYVEAGDRNAPTVIFLHGIGGSWEAFCANIGPYAKNHRVLAFDFIGAGFTDKPDQPIYEASDYVEHLHGFMNAMAVETASLVGVSMGGWMAVIFAHRYPEKVDKMVLCAASGMKRPKGFTPPAATSIRNDRKAAIDNPTWDNVAKIFNDLMFLPEKRLPDFIKLRQTVYKMPEMKASMGRILAITTNDNFDKSTLTDAQWSEIQAPVLLIESSDDSEHFRKNTARAHGLLPNSTVFSMSQVAHWPPFEDPETFNDATLKFLA